jgi:hypothetical protein
MRLTGLPMPVTAWPSVSGNVCATFAPANTSATATTLQSISSVSVSGPLAVNLASPPAAKSPPGPTSQQAAYGPCPGLLFDGQPVRFD